MKKQLLFIVIGCFALWAGLSQAVYAKALEKVSAKENAPTKEESEENYERKVLFEPIKEVNWAEFWAEEDVVDEESVEDRDEEISQNEDGESDPDVELNEEDEKLIDEMMDRYRERAKKEYEEKKELMEYATIIYRNVYSYSHYCETKGHKLVRYPVIFKEKHAAQIKKMEDGFDDYGFSAEDVFTFLEKDGALDERGKYIIEGMRKKVIRARIKRIEEAKGKTEVMDDYGKLFSTKEICEMLDRLADRFVEKASFFE